MNAESPARVPILWLLLPFCTGIAFVRLVPFDFNAIVFAIGLALGFAALFVGHRYEKLWAPSIALCLILAGYSYTSYVDRQNQPRTDLPVREVSISIEVKRLFDTDTDKIKGLGKIVATQDHLADLTEAKLYFSLNSSPESDTQYAIVPGSLIQAQGVLKPVSQQPRDNNGFNSYLQNSGMAFLLERGIIDSTLSQTENWSSRLNRILQSAKAALSYGVDPESPFTKSHTAMLLGLKGELDDDHKNAFLRSGALHLFAISGLHIGVIAACGHALFSLIRITRVWIPIPNLILVAFFVSITGGTPSAWRALLMIACYYLCLSTKRRSASLNALVLSALICLLINPLQLFLAGFQMSYATVAAILLYGVPLADRLNNRWTPFARIPRRAWSYWHSGANRVGRFFISSFAISLSAFLASSALSILYFNTLPLVGIFANILLLPLASLAIISGFISLSFATLGAWPLVSLFNHSAQVILSLMYAILESLGSLKGSHVVFDAPPSRALHLLLILLLLGMMYGYSRNWNFRKRWLWAFPFAYSTACLAAGLFLT